MDARGVPAERPGLGTQLGPKGGGWKPAKLKGKTKTKEKGKTKTVEDRSSTWPPEAATFTR